MIKGISAWASNIIVVVIVSTIIEMILPNSNNKKYVKTVIGVFILFTILEPIIINLSIQEFSLESIKKQIKFENMDLKKLDTTKTLEYAYVENLKTDLKSKIENLGYKANEVHISVNMKEGNDYGKIEGISFRIQRLNTKIGEIEPISIDLNDNIYIKENEINEVKKFLTSAYSIDEEIINIY